METRQFFGKTADEATDLALETLGVNREDVEITIVDPGRSGILGFGGAPAIIEVSLIGEAAAASEARQREEEERERQPGGLPVEPRRPDPPRRGREMRASGRQPASADRVRPVHTAPAPDEAPAGEPERDLPPAPLPRPPEDAQPAERDDEAEQLVTQLLDYFLSSMGVVAATYVRDEMVDGAIAFDIEGEDAGLLIGRRGETLQALQFLVHMIVNRQLGRKAYVVIDVEGYRERRSEMLRTLARRTAGRVASSGNPASLDPMSPAERRIVHMALANHPQVRTESEGEGGRRRVVIFPRD
ncbi:MAG: protein jag [Chloroflexi bacterium]|nr:protein jag [Chloroflexota bacterium]